VADWNIKNEAIPSSYKRKTYFRRIDFIFEYSQSFFLILLAFLLLILVFTLLLLVVHGRRRVWVWWRGRWGRRRRTRWRWTILKQFLPSSSMSTFFVSASAPGPSAAAISLFSWGLNNEPIALYFFVIHFFDSCFSIIVVLKLLYMDESYNERVWAFVLNAYDFAIFFEPWFQIIFCSIFSIPLDIDLGVSDSSRHYKCWFGYIWFYYKFKSANYYLKSASILYHIIPNNLKLELIWFSW